MSKEKTALKVKYIPCLSDLEEVFSLQGTPNVKGRLKNNVKFWESIGTNRTILDIIRNGYKIPFYSEPKKKSFSNNKSALTHTQFVENEIKSLQETGRIIETSVRPYVVNPLSVDEKDGKLRFILDLTYVNFFVFKDPIKYDDWKTMEHLVQKDDYLFKFDIKSGYHHIDIYPGDQKFLGFSWPLDGVTRYYFFTVLPFGLCTGPFIFTKVMRPLVALWRAQAIRICCYLDDGLGASQPYSQSVYHSEMVRNTLLAAGFVINEEKSIWQPTKSISWLGIDYNSEKNVLKITEKRRDSILRSLDYIIDNLPYTTPRKLSRLCGKVMSTMFVVGKLTRLKTRR